MIVEGVLYAIWYAVRWVFTAVLVAAGMLIVFVNKPGDGYILFGAFILLIAYWSAPKVSNRARLALNELSERLAPYDSLITFGVVILLPLISLWLIDGANDYSFIAALAFFVAVVVPGTSILRRKIRESFLSWSHRRGEYFRSLHEPARRRPRPDAH